MITFKRPESRVIAAAFVVFLLALGVLRMVRDTLTPVQAMPAQTIPALPVVQSSMSILPAANSALAGAPNRLDYSALPAELFTVPPAPAAMQAPAPVVPLTVFATREDQTFGRMVAVDGGYEFQCRKIGGPDRYGMDDYQPGVVYLGQPEDGRAQWLVLDLDQRNYIIELCKG